MQFHFLSSQRRHQQWQVLEALAVYEQAIKGVAHRTTPCLRIVYNSLAFVQVACLVEIAMHHTGACLYYRHLCSVADEGYEPLAPSWNAKVNISHGCQQCAGSLMCGREQFHYSWVDAVGIQDVVYKLHLSPVGAVGFLAAFEQSRVSTLEAE